MPFQVTQNNNWVVFSIEDRLDAFNSEDFRNQMDTLVKENSSSKVALELTNTQFLSLPIIKYFTGVATEITNRGGKFALVGTPEKLKRQIDIFASLKPMMLFRSQEDWETGI